MLVRLLALSALLTAVAPALGVQAQRELYRRASAETQGAEYRLADANGTWFVLERDRDTEHQELLVLSARDGVEVLRTDGMSLVAGSRHSVGQTWDLTLRPQLSGDRLITFRHEDALVALDIPSGRELWRLALPADEMVHGALTVTDTRVAWADRDNGLRVFDAATGRAIFQAPMRPRTSAGCVAFDASGGVSALTQEFELVSWDAAGVEQTRVPLQPDWGVHQVIRRGELAVMLGRSAHVVDTHTGSVQVRSAPAQSRTTGAFVSEDVLVLATHDDVAALSARTLTPLWRVQLRGHVVAANQHLVTVALDNGVVVWLAARTGHRVAALGVGEPAHRWRYHPRRSWGIAAGARSDGASASTSSFTNDVILVRTANASFIGFALEPALVQPYAVAGTVVANGRRARDVAVHVGEAVVRSDARGRFHASVSLPGIVRARVDAEEVRRTTHLPCAQDALAEFDPAAPGLVLLSSRAQGYECDSACTCD